MRHTNTIACSKIVFIGVCAENNRLYSSKNEHLWNDWCSHSKQARSDSSVYRTKITTASYSLLNVSFVSVLRAEVITRVYLDQQRIGSNVHCLTLFWNNSAIVKHRQVFTRDCWHVNWLSCAVKMKVLQRPIISKMIWWHWASSRNMKMRYVHIFSRWNHLSC